MGLTDLCLDSSASDAAETGDINSTSGDGSLSNLITEMGIGDGYGIATYWEPATPTSVSGDLTTLTSDQSTTPSASLIASAFNSTLGTILGLAQINADPMTGYYKASNGNIYPDGTGPGSVPLTNPLGNGLFFLILIGGLIWALEEGKL